MHAGIVHRRRERREMKFQVYLLVTIVMDKDPSKGIENRVVFHTVILPVIDMLLESGGDEREVAKSKEDVTLV